MALQIGAATNVCQTVARQVRERFRNLTMHFILHHEGQHAEAIGMAGQAITHHPAAETAIHLLTRARNDGEASLIGMAVAPENMFMGLACSESVLALCAVNIDRCDSPRGVARQAWHLVWHALDAWQYRNDQAQQNGHHIGEITIHSRNGLEMASANLQADTFSAVMNMQTGDRDATRKTGIMRGMNVLHPGPAGLQGPEHFPFVVAMETAVTAMKDLAARPVPRRKQIDAALKIAREVGRTFDEASIRHWLSFSEPAQDMAWRGYSREQILSAAINTSENTHVRATGYMVAEMTGIKPASVLEIRGNYSPYADEAFNRQLHDRAVKAVFEYVIAQGLHSGNTDIFIETANSQNRDLLRGHVTGWCAGALQASGRAFGNALKNGAGPAEAAARHHFENNRDDVEWESLQLLGHKIVARTRQGRETGLADLAGMCHDERELAAVARSVDLTIKTPGLRKAPGMEPGGNAPRPRGPAPPDVAPRIAVAPGLGLGSSAAVVRTATTATAATAGDGET